MRAMPWPAKAEQRVGDMGQRIILHGEDGSPEYYGYPMYMS